MLLRSDWCASSDSSTRTYLFSRMFSRAILPGMGDSRETTQATAIGSDEEVLLGAEALFVPCTSADWHLVHLFE